MNIRIFKDLKLSFDIKKSVLDRPQQNTMSFVFIFLQRTKYCSAVWVRSPVRVRRQHSRLESLSLISSLTHNDSLPAITPLFHLWLGSLQTSSIYIKPVEVLIYCWWTVCCCSTLVNDKPPIVQQKYRGKKTKHICNHRY